MARSARTVLAFVALLPLAGCSAVDGPQLGRVPPGLGYISAVVPSSPPLTKRFVQRQFGYVTAGDVYERVTITEYAGMATTDEIIRSREELADRSRGDELGEMDYLTVDRRPAMGWSTAFRVNERTYARGFTVVVPYRYRTYSIEYFTRDERNQDASYLRSVVASFHVPNPWSEIGAVMIVLGLIVALVTHATERGLAGGTASDTVSRLLRR